MRLRIFESTTGLGVMMALALISTPANAAPDAAKASPSQPVASSTVSGAKQHAAQTYWTADRMRSAKPGDRLLRGKSLADITSKVAAGKPVTKAGTAGKSRGGKALLASGGGYYTGGGNVVKTTGKVFFTLGGSNYQCSGSSAVSNNESVVQTAGHCVNEGRAHSPRTSCSSPPTTTARGLTAHSPHANSSLRPNGTAAATSTMTSASLWSAPSAER